MNDDLKQTIKRFLPSSLVVATRPMRQYFDPQRRFDRRLGVDTSGEINVDRLDVTTPHASGYEPTPPAIFHRIMKRVPMKPERSIFVDLGSGKGAVLLYALAYPFRQILGVELSPTLHEVARRNLDHVQRGLPDLRAWSLCLSAADFVFPEDPTVIFLGNPFKGALLDAVVGNLGRSLREHPREACVIYYHRLSRHGAWDAASYLKTIHHERSHTVYAARG